MRKILDELLDMNQVTIYYSQEEIMEFLEAMILDRSMDVTLNDLKDGGHPDDKAIKYALFTFAIRKRMKELNDQVKEDKKLKTILATED